jgi:hypothetical protein
METYWASLRRIRSFRHSYGCKDILCLMPHLRENLHPTDGKKEAPHRFSRSLFLIYAPYQKLTGTDNDTSQIDSRVLVSLSCVNRLDHCL